MDVQAKASPILQRQVSTLDYSWQQGENVPHKPDGLNRGGSLEQEIPSAPRLCGVILTAIRCHRVETFETLPLPKNKECWLINLSICCGLYVPSLFDGQKFQKTGRLHCPVSIQTNYKSRYQTDTCLPCPQIAARFLLV